MAFQLMQLTALIVLLDKIFLLIQQNFQSARANEEP